jgi:hypothetical protein
MFERMEGRIARRAHAAARRRAEAVAERLRGELPSGIAAAADEAGVQLSGRGLRRRMALRPELRALGARLK